MRTWYRLVTAIQSTLADKVPSRMTNGPDEHIIELESESDKADSSRSDLVSIPAIPFLSRGGGSSTKFNQLFVVTRNSLNL